MKERILTQRAKMGTLRSSIRNMREEIEANRSLQSEGPQNTATIRYISPPRQAVKS